MAWLVGFALGKRRTLDGGTAEKTGDRLLKQARKVRTADSERSDEQRTAAHAKPYPEPITGGSISSSISKRANTGQRGGGMRRPR